MSLDKSLLYLKTIFNGMNVKIFYDDFINMKKLKTDFLYVLSFTLKVIKYFRTMQLLMSLKIGLFTETLKAKCIILRKENLCFLNLRKNKK